MESRVVSWGGGQKLPSHVLAAGGCVAGGQGRCAWGAFTFSLAAMAACERGQRGAEAWSQAEQQPAVGA